MIRKEILSINKIVEHIKSETSIEYDTDKKKILCENRWEIKLPLIVDRHIEEKGIAIQKEPEKYLFILIRAGATALGFFENGELRLHKVIKTYMVRKKQGKSQLTHLKTKGKSKLGSRIRLRNSDTFFENISIKIDEWEINDYAQKIFIYCPVALKQFFYGTDVKLPFDKNDPRIVKIPIDIRTPDFEELIKTEKRLHYGEINYLDSY